ncbi:MAG: DUF2119 domain-containing protein [Euryarchaeota archaeon]|nr:DUF2119 domain-containing protein [Euryarchaeota archaeon]MBU4491286.1 DUF2119 domain-containing protein [Euryarchaeota archaeon]MCG2728358.1 DUF2119 domain-containing protein [Candidatus Methanoperedenaceae archaeon]
MFFKILGSGKPSRLLIAGIHGNEEALTEPILKLFAQDIQIRSGRLIICSLSGGDPYISTLDKAYYDSKTGRKLLGLIREYRPRIYLELHSYGLENYSKLTDPDRKNKIGVPPLTELEEKVLIGSVSPLIRTTEFNMEDFCFIIELPTLYSEQALSTALDVLTIIALSTSRDEIISKLRGKYPEQICEAEKNFREFFKDIKHRKLSFF